MRHFILGMFLFFVGFGCGSGGKTNGVPDVNFTCTSAATTECVAAADGTQLIAAFFSGTTCDELLNSDNPPLAAGTETAVSCDASGCTGSATSGWMNDASPAKAVTELSTGKTAVAAIVDADGDSLEGPEAGDILACKDVTLESDTTSVSLDDTDVVAIP